MSKYTTGEIAKLCNVTVRTVQYYDSKGILNPSEVTEGGRRVYSDDDLDRMKVICFLRDLDISISSIQDILNEENPDNVIKLLLGRQQEDLKSEIAEKQEKLDKLVALSRIVSKDKDLNLSSIGDAAKIMTNKKKLNRIRRNMILALTPVTLIEDAALIYGIIKGNWWPFAVMMLLVIPLCIITLNYYSKRVKYICPECHKAFIPKKGEMFWAGHTPNTRKLTCPSCNKKRWCVEIFNEEFAKASENF